LSGHESSTKAILYALLANFGIAVAKLVASLYTKSGSMLAEAVHSFADCSNQLLLFLGLKRSKRPPTDEHPLGYGKVIYFWSFIVAILLFSIGGAFSIYEGVHKVMEPEALNDVWVALIVLFVSIGLESFSLIGAIREINKLKGSKSLKQWIKTTRNAELIVILGEDVAAIVGLTIAFAFVLTAFLTNNPIYDAVGSIAIGLILITISIFLSIRIKSLIIGRSADPELQEIVQNKISQNPDVKEIFNIITIQFGSNVMFAAKLRFCNTLNIDSVCNSINQLEKEIKIAYPEIKWCFIEPDIAE